jgi:uncharacterized membrane protein HdeD (DUF308 family)
MDNFFARAWWVLALRGVFAILFGALALMWPQLTLLTLVALFAAYALLSGITSIIGAIRNRRTDDDWWVMLLLGIVSTGAGILSVAAIRLRKAIAGEWMLALSGLASVAFGAIVFFAPAAGALATVWLISMYALVTGVLLLVAAARARSLVKGKEMPRGERRHMMGDRRASPAH